MYVRVCICTYVRVYVCMYVCMYVCIYVCMHVCTHVHACVCVFTLARVLPPSSSTGPTNSMDNMRIKKNKTFASH